MNVLLKKLLVLIRRKTEELTMEENSKNLVMGKGSRIYPETTIHNFPKKPQNIQLGEFSHIRGELLVFNYGGSITIGNYSFVGENTRIWSGEHIHIGNHVLISHNCNIIDSNTHELHQDDRAQGFKDLITKGQAKEKGSVSTKPIVIEDHVWINFNVTILKGVTIGKGSIIGANAIITKDIPPYTRVLPSLENHLEPLPDAVR